MSMIRSTRIAALAAAAGAVLAIAGSAHGQDSPGQSDRFFSDKISAEEEEGEKPTSTLYQGSLTTTTFVYRESGAKDVGAANVESQANNVSPSGRTFADVRAQLDAKHIGGGMWDARLDARARLVSGCAFQSPSAQLLPPCRVQAGLYGENEYDAREVYVRRTGEKLDMQLGRQYILELAATKIDGVKVTYQGAGKLSYIAFGGLYPTRGSRSIKEDYPVTIGGDMAEKRILPVAGGAGAAYRYKNMYGAVGAVGILPRGQELQSGLEEVPRIFLTASGYWRQSEKLDLYHFAVLDAQSSGGRGLTNLSLGVNYRPSSNMRVSVGVNRVDTETLNIQVQNRLEDNGTGIGGATNSVQNNFEVSRTASESARVGLSVGLKQQRFQVSVSGRLRRRGDIQLPRTDPALAPELIPASQAAEVLLSVVDRQSFKKLRLGGSFLRILGLGEPSYHRSTATLGRVFGAREFKQGKGQLEVDVSYLKSDDEQFQDSVCASPVDCYGTSSVQSITLGGTMFYRFKPDWFAVAMLSAGRQTLTDGVGMDDTKQPASTLLTGFLRLAYRF